MNPATLGILLQLVAALLSGVQNNPQASTAATQEAVAFASRAIQIAAQVQASSKINFLVPQNDAIPPDIKDLSRAAYIGPNGTYIPLSDTNALIPGDTSFGDINGDGLDDAAAIIQKTDSSGNTTLELAAMLNQGGVMFNIANLPLDPNLQIVSHDIAGGDIIINTATYYLFGDQLFKL